MISLTQLIKEAYSHKIVAQLIDKFKAEQPTLTPEIITSYIGRFDQIKNSPNVTQKDIFQYNWKDFERVVDANQKKKIKAGKIDVTVEDANLVYNQNQIRVYVAKSQKACIKYGTGYSFCISARSEDNMFSHYRKGHGSEIGTPYFVFNDTLSKEQNKDGSFVDPRHILVIFFNVEEADEQEYFSYSITDADNNGDTSYDSFSDVVKAYPWTAQIKSVINTVELHPSEKKLKQLTDVYNDKIMDVISASNMYDFIDRRLSALAYDDYTEEAIQYYTLREVYIREYFLECLEVLANKKNMYGVLKASNAIPWTFICTEDQLEKQIGRRFKREIPGIVEKELYKRIRMSTIVDVSPLAKEISDKFPKFKEELAELAKLRHAYKQKADHLQADVDSN